MSEVWSQPARGVDIDRGAYVGDGTPAMAVKSNAEAPGVELEDCSDEQGTAGLVVTETERPSAARACRGAPAVRVRPRDRPAPVRHPSNDRVSSRRTVVCVGCRLVVLAGVRPVPRPGRAVRAQRRGHPPAVAERPERWPTLRRPRRVRSEAPLDDDALVAPLAGGVGACPAAERRPRTPPTTPAGLWVRGLGPESLSTVGGVDGPPRLW